MSSSAIPPAALPGDPALGPALGPIAANLARVRQSIAEACRRANRDPASVTLVAVSKTNPSQAVLAALAAGQTVFGENRVQEAQQKFPSIRPDHPALRLHLIGALQTNKARDAVRIADVIESLDRPKLAVALAEAMAKEGRRPTLLIQVNIGDEPQKAGIAPAALPDFLRFCREEQGLEIDGLMCIPPVEGDPTPHFRSLAAMGAAHGLSTLSMGMSSDYAQAIAAGATHVRIGSAIFGLRA